VGSHSLFLKIGGGACENKRKFRVNVYSQAIPSALEQKGRAVWGS